MSVDANGVEISTAKLPKGDFEAELSFPDWKENVDDTLAMNNMYGFLAYHNQGTLYVTVSKKVESFVMFINHHKINTKKMVDGTYLVDFSSIAIDGKNVVQVCGIIPSTLKNAIKVYVPYPTVIEGSIKESGISKEAFDTINDIITQDIEHGFTSAQLAVIKNGALVYQNAWGKVNSYLPDGSVNAKSNKVTNETMYDLASVTKMYSIIYAVQYLVQKEVLRMDDRVADLVGKEFVDKTIDINYDGYDKIPLEKNKEWKKRITLKDLLMHRAGFPKSGHYHIEYYDVKKQQLSSKTKNLLYVEYVGKDTKKKTLVEGICKTPLMYKPRTKTLYSDIDYQLLGFIIEKVTKKDLNTFLKETFWEPLGLEHITYCPLEHGFQKEDCAATELNGNTRDGLIHFDKIREETIQGEVHDEEAYYTMGGVAGHAGLFASATDLAILSYLMLTGGIEDQKFFDKNTIDYFTSPQMPNVSGWGIGWWRVGNNDRVWYFSSQAPSTAIGHEGWTGTLTMIDFENQMVIVYLTNKKNTALTNPGDIETLNKFNGDWYTSASLGFITQLIYMGCVRTPESKDAFDYLLSDMASEKLKLVRAEKRIPRTHAVMQAWYALLEACAKRAKRNGSSTMKKLTMELMKELDKDKDKEEIKILKGML